jgi:thymidylate synthase (FAD)
MKLIKPSVEYIPQEDLYKHIELCSRVCYKSEDRITEDSAKKMIDGLIKAGHGAMLEHGTIYFQRRIDFGSRDYMDFEDKYATNPYSKIVYSAGIAYVTTNLRVLIENDWLDELQYACNPAKHHEIRYTMKFICDRGVSHELVRHRVFSFAQESQRYCNYSKDKFGGVSFIEPSWFNSKDSSSEQREAFIQICQDSEECYLKLLDNWDNKKPDRRFKTGFKGNPLTPQQARGVLPNATKTEIVMTGFADDWKHFFDLRLRGTTGKPHPDMQHIAQLAWNEFKNKLNLEL